MARFWTCRKCGQRWPRTKQLCTCGRKRPAPSGPRHRAVLDMPYEEWVERYGNTCNICGRPASARRRLDRDHDHATGLPRGLLCHICNRSLGNRTAEWLDAAAAYLRRGVARGV